jgi:carboxylate-amine ligase
MARAAGVPDYTWFWWKLRPHPRLGTVEVRCLDVQAGLRDTAALAALVHCLARHHAEHAIQDPSPPELIEEGLHRAARYGTAARLPGRDGEPRPLAAVLDEALARCEPHVGELGCRAQLEDLDALVGAGGGAGRQRAVCEVAGMQSLLRALAARAGEPAAGA